MKISLLFRQYIWLVNALNSQRGLSFAELQDHWLRSDLSEGQPLSRATFNRHKDAIEDIFGLYVVCDRSNGYRYRIGNRRVLSEDSLQTWMLSTLTVNQLLHEACALQERILIEPVLADNELLHLLIRAMKTNHRVHITYQKYNTAEAKEHDVEPLCLKLFRQRWYLLGRFDDDFMAVFAIDRMVEVEIRPDTFTPNPDFIPADYFDEYFGVITDQRQPLEHVVLRFRSYQRHYIDDLPLHHSQRLIHTTDDYDDYEYRLRITPDFVCHLLSMGATMEVREPKWLKQQVVKEMKEALRQYVGK